MDGSERDVAQAWRKQAQWNRGVLADYSAGRINGEFNEAELASFKAEAERCEALAAALEADSDD